MNDLRFRHFIIYTFIFVVSLFFNLQRVNAAEINAQFDGHAVFFLNDSPYPDGANTGYNSSYTQDQVPIPDASRFPINIPGYFNAYGSGTFYPVKQIGIVNDNFAFRGGVRYEFRFDFKWVYNNNDYINDTTRSYSLWNTHSDDSVLCDSGNTPCSVRWEHITTGYYAPYYTAVVTYIPQYNKTGVVVDLGSVNNENQAVFINYAPEASHLAISRSSINGYVDSTGDDIINSSNDNTDRIIENDNKNQQETNDRLDSIGDKLTDSYYDDSQTDSLLDSFEFYENNSLSSIITSPLNFIRSLANVNSCQPITLTAFHKSFQIECGTTLFWDRQDVSAFKTFWNILFGGVIIYRLLLRLFIVVNDVLDPTKDSIGGVDI